MMSWSIRRLKRYSSPILVTKRWLGADPGVQEVNLQMILSHPPGRRMPLISAMPAVISVAFTRWRHIIHTTDTSVLLIY